VNVHECDTQLKVPYYTIFTSDPEEPSELPESDQRKIRGTTIHAIIFVQKQTRDNDTSMYQVFERINTGGRTLSPQEIRNCVYQGLFNSLLIELNKNGSIAQTMSSETKSRGKACQKKGWGGF
jgi:hypothetical protein